MRCASMSLIRANAGASVVEMMVARLLIELLPLVNHKLASEDVALYAKRICTQYWHFKIEDIAICLNRGLEGRYGKKDGKIYGSWTYSVFVEWATEYEVERQVEIEEFRSVEKKITPQEPLNPEIGKKLSELADKLLEKKPKKELSPRKRTKIDDLMEEFDKLWGEEFPQGAHGKRFITYEGKKTDMNEFINIKLK